MDLHLIKNVKSVVNKLDTINKTYVDRIKYKAAICILPNTVMTDHTLFTFPAAKAFASGKIIICEMWVERFLMDEPPTVRSRTAIGVWDESGMRTVDGD